MELQVVPGHKKYSKISFTYYTWLARNSRGRASCFTVVLVNLCVLMFHQCPDIVPTVSRHCPDTVPTMSRHRSKVHQNYSETSRETSRVPREPNIVCKRYLRMFFRGQCHLELCSRANFRLGYRWKVEQNLEITLWLAIVWFRTVKFVEALFFSKYILTMYTRSTVSNISTIFGL